MALSAEFSNLIINGATFTFNGQDLTVNGSGVSNSANLVHVTGDQNISGNKSFFGNIRGFVNGNVESFSSAAQTLNDYNGIPSFYWHNRTMFDSGEMLSIDYGNRTLIDSTMGIAATWQDRTLFGNWEISNTPNSDFSIINKGYADSNWVNLTGGQEIFGSKKFSGPVEIKVDDIIVLSSDGNLRDTSDRDSIDWENRYLHDASSNIVADWNEKELYSHGVPIIDWNEQFLYDDDATKSVNWDGRLLLDDSENTTLNWKTKTLSGVWRTNGTPTGVLDLVNKSYLESNTTFLNAKNFGAVGDGVANDNVALQTAINAANTQGRPLYIPPGTYKLTGALNIPNTAMWVFGAGGDRTIIRQTTNGQSAITFTTNINQVCIERMRIQGNGTGSATVPGIITPASTNNIDEFVLRDLDVRGFSIGIQLQDVANALIERVQCFNNTNGMRVLGNANAIHYSSCNWVENSGYGLRLEGGKGHLISTGEFGGPLQTGGQLIIAGAGSCIVNGMNMEVYGGDAITHTVASTTLVLNNVHIGGFAGSGYSVVMGQNYVTINNCLFSHAVSGSHIKQTATFACSLYVWGGTLKVDVFSGVSLFGSYQTNPLVNLTELQASGQTAIAGTVGFIQRRMETGALEAWYATLRKTDGSYEYVSLTPLRTANTWSTAQTFAGGFTVSTGGANITGNVFGSADFRAGASSFFYWAGRSSMKSTADGSISFRNQTDTLDSDISCAKVTASNDIEITAIGKGVIMKSPNGTRWRLTPSDAGASVWTSL